VVDDWDKQESHAAARKLRDGAAILFGLKFAKDIHYTSDSVAKLRKQGFSAPNILAHCSIRCLVEP